MVTVIWFWFAACDGVLIHLFVDFLASEARNGRTGEGKKMYI
jgi:hypothetical protein